MAGETRKKIGTYMENNTNCFDEEFQTVQLIMNSNAVTAGVDAFSLSLIKAERQVRRLVTFLVFQFPCFGYNDVKNLREALFASKKVYFDGCIKGFDALYPRSIEMIMGAEYKTLKAQIVNAINIRNKIFHGQLTNQYLSKKDLVSFISSISIWCKTIAVECHKEFGFCGFARNSFRKSLKEGLTTKFRYNINSLEDYKLFISGIMSRK